MPDQADTSTRTDHRVECRVRIIAAQYRPFIGLHGRVVERDLRSPFVRVELDQVPQGCSDRTFWFALERVQRL